MTSYTLGLKCSPHGHHSAPHLWIEHPKFVVTSSHILESVLHPLESKRLTLETTLPHSLGLQCPSLGGHNATLLKAMMSHISGAEHRIFWGQNTLYFRVRVPYTWVNSAPFLGVSATCSWVTWFHTLMSRHFTLGGVTVCHTLGSQWLTYGGLNILDLGFTVPIFWGHNARLLGQKLVTLGDHIAPHLSVTVFYSLGLQWSMHRHHFSLDLWVMIPHILDIQHALESNCPTIWDHSAPLFGLILHHTSGSYISHLGVTVTFKSHGATICSKNTPCLGLCWRPWCYKFRGHSVLDIGVRMPLTLGLQCPT